VLEGLEDRLLLAGPDIYTVDLTSDTGANTGLYAGDLAYCITQANADTNPAGTEIMFDPTVFNTTTHPTIALSSTLGLSETAGPEVIDGPGANVVTINGGGTIGIFNVASGTTANIAGLTLTNGYALAGDGGGIFNDGMLTVTNCTLSDNSASMGGGGILNGGTLTVTNSTLSDNSASDDGGGIVNGGTLTVTNSTLSGNTSAFGGGIFNDGMLTVTNCTLSDNSASMGGGGIYNYFGPSALANTIVAKNTNTSSTPATPDDIDNALGTVSGSYNLIGTGGSGGLTNGSNGNQVGVANPGLDSKGLQDNGGPTQTIALVAGSPAIDAGSDLLIPAGTTTDQRGFPRIANGTVDIGAFEVQVYMAYSTGDSGGGSLRTALTNANQARGSVVVVTATSVIGLLSPLPTLSQDVQIVGPGANNLTVSGSGMLPVFNIASGVSVTMAGLTIADGSSSTSGGAIENDGTLSLTNCTVSNSTAATNGGGIDNQGMLTLTASTVSGNSATAGNGGGIENDGTLFLFNSTIANNTAGSNGGGIENATSTSKITSTNSTIAGNSAAGNGGGIDNSGSGLATPANTIVASNSVPSSGSGPDFYGFVTSKGYNLVGNPAGSVGFTGPGDISGVNPVLGTLQNNGGATQTMALLPGSPAIAAGSVALALSPSGSSLTTDQRGVPRTFNGKVDIGAFQSRGFTIAVIEGSNQQAVVNTAFPSPLVVIVSSPFGDPVQGGVVTFTAPSSGHSATFPNGSAATIDSSGLAGLIAAANTIAGSYTVTASANGATGTGLSFNLTNVAGPASQLVIHTQPSSTAVAGQLFATQPVIYELDKYGNLETQDNSTKVSASLHNTTTSLQTVTVVGGVATFTSLSYTKSGSITLDFTSGTLTKATSNAITIKAAAASKFLLDIPNTGSFTTGRAYTIVVLAEDAYGNQATGYRGSVQFTASKVTTLPGYYGFTASDSGVHTFTDGVTFGQAGTVTISVYDTATPSIKGSVTVTVGSDPPAATTKAKSRRLVRRVPAASAKLQARAAVELQSGNLSKAQQTIVSAGGSSLHPAALIARHAPVVAQADVVREHILAQLSGGLRAYLAADKLASARLE
jgi:hypothetical protein